MTKLPLLICEGVDDFHVIKNLLFAHKIYDKNEKNKESSYEIKENGGLDQLLGTMQAELRDTMHTAIGFVFDADVDIQMRWDQIKYHLEQSGCENVPSRPDPKGTIVRDSRDRKIGVWLMPNNVTGGMLEDFLAALITTNDTLWPRAQNAVGDIPDEERRFNPLHLKKAEVHTWLAWQNEPGTQMGGTFKREYVDSTTDSAMVFVNWIKRLFS